MSSPSHQICELQPRSAQLVVEPDTEVVQRNPRRETGSQTPDLVGPLPPEAQGVEELIVDCLHDLTDRGNPPPQALGPGLSGVSLGRMDYLRPVAFEPAPVVLFSLEAFVGHVDSREGCTHACEPRVGVSPQRQEALGQWLIGGGGTPETETRYCPGGLYSGKQGEALVPPYAVGPADVGLSGEPAMPAALGVPDGHSRAIECLVGRSLTLQHFPQFHSDLLDVLSIESHEPVELGTVWKGRECCSQMCLGVAVEVPFAGEPRPPSEDREGDDLTTTEGGIRTGSASYGSMRLAKIVDHDVKCGEEGVHVNHEESVPFPSGLVSKPTLVRGHLPLKSSRDNSHQAFKGGGVPLSWDQGPNLVGQSSAERVLLTPLRTLHPANGGQPRARKTA